MCEDAELEADDDDDVVVVVCGDKSVMEFERYIQSLGGRRDHSPTFIEASTDFVNLVFELSP